MENIATDFSGHSGCETARTHKTILIVDDYPAALRLFARLLRTAGYTVIEADSPSEALATVNSRASVDLLLTDYQMPGMNGVELAASTRERRPEIPVLLLTWSPELAAMNGHFHPSFVCRSKDWNPDELLSTVAGMLDERGKVACRTPRELREELDEMRRHEMKKNQTQKIQPPELSVVLGGKGAVAPDPKDIATAAYYAWERDGKPDGRDMEYWLAAEATLRTNNSRAHAA